MHILVTRFSSLGDVILQTSIVSWLKMTYPRCKITFLTANEFTSLLEGHPHIDKVCGMPRFKGIKGIFELKSFVQKLHTQQHFDLILDLHGTTRSSLVKLFLPFVKSLSVDKRRLERFLFVNFKINFLKNTPSIHTRHHQDFSHILGEFDETKLSEFISQNKKLGVTSSPVAFLEDRSPIDSPYIVLSPVASFAPKRWPVENFYQLAINLLEDQYFKKFKVVVLAGPRDDYCKIFNKLEDDFKERFVNLQGKTDLKESMHYLKHCNLCVGNDTGLNHIAESCGNPVITIFGPTHESLGFSAHLKNSINLSLNLNCRPCSTTGKKACKYKEQICMTKISVDMVIGKAKEIL